VALVQERYSDFGPTFAHEKLTEVGQAVFRNISLMGAMPTFPADVARATHLELLDHWRSGALKVVGNQIFSFADGNKAIEHIAAGKVEGKVVVRVRD